jgi:TonB family protein
MRLLLEITARVSIVMLLALGPRAALRHRSAALRHWVLAVAIACAAATPLAMLVAPAWQIPVGRLVPLIGTVPAGAEVTTSFEVAGPRPPAAVAAASSAASRPSSGVDRVLVRLWIAGMLASIGVLAAGVARFAWIVARARPAANSPWAALAGEIACAQGITRPVDLLETDRPSLLVTWGTLRPKVLLPSSARDWSIERARVVLGHELAHVRRCDWAVQIAVEIVCAIYWFNPLLWIVSRSLRQESECACDDAVLNQGEDSTAYAAHLLAIARAGRDDRRLWLPAPAIAHPSSLERRVTAMLNTEMNRTSPSSWTRAAVVLALSIVTLPLAGLSAQSFATVFGVVTDSSGAFLPNATLRLTNDETKSKYEVRTDRTGHFEFVGLPAGTYAFESQYPGFSTLRDQLSVSAGQTLDRPITLQVGSLEETITVTDGPDEPSSPRVRGGYARTVPACRPGPTGDVPIGGNLKPPTKVLDVRPDYPASMRGTNTAGRVELVAVIGTDGIIKDVRPVSSTNPDFENAAAAAVSQWQFTPTLLNCVPVEVKMTTHITFSPKQ